MGYSTTLYAVDLAALRSAVGSRDADLLQRLRPAKKSSKADKRNPERDGPRVKLTRHGEILLNGQSVTFEELSAALGRPEWKDTYIRSYIEAAFWICEVNSSPAAPAGERCRPASKVRHRMRRKRGSRRRIAIL